MLNLITASCFTDYCLVKLVLCFQCVCGWVQTWSVSYRFHCPPFKPSNDELWPCTPRGLGKFPDLLRLWNPHKSAAWSQTAVNNFSYFLKSWQCGDAGFASESDCDGGRAWKCEILSSLLYRQLLLSHTWISRSVELQCFYYVEFESIYCPWLQPKWLMMPSVVVHYCKLTQAQQTGSLVSLSASTSDVTIRCVIYRARWKWNTCVQLDRRAEFQRRKQVFRRELMKAFYPRSLMRDCGDYVNSNKEECSVSVISHSAALLALSRCIVVERRLLSRPPVFKRRLLSKIWIQLFLDAAVTDRGVLHLFIYLKKTLWNCALCRMRIHKNCI